MPLTLTDEQVKRLEHAYESLMLAIPPEKRGVFLQHAWSDILSILHYNGPRRHGGGKWTRTENIDDTAYWEALK